MSKYYEVSEDTIDRFNKIYKSKSFAINIDFHFQGFENQKKMIDITKIPEKYEVALQKSLYVSFNEDIMNVLDDESVDILIEQELDKITYNVDSGKVKIIKPDFITFTSLINKHGIDKIGRANQVEELYIEQNNDKDDFIV